MHSVLRGTLHALRRNKAAWLVDKPGARNTTFRPRSFFTAIRLSHSLAIVPESPAEPFDGTETEEILTLRVLILTDEKGCEARRRDRCARRVIRGAEALDRSSLQSFTERSAREAHGDYEDGGHDE